MAILEVLEPSRLGAQVVENAAVTDFLAARGIELAIHPAEDQFVISTTFAGFTRTLTVSSEAEVRVVTDTHAMQQVFGTESVSPILVFIEPNAGITVSTLCEEPPCGVPTAKFIKPLEANGVRVEEAIGVIESHVGTQIDGESYVLVELPGEFVDPQLRLDHDGKFLVRRNQDKLEWFYPKMTKLKRTDIRARFRDAGATQKEKIDLALQMIHKSSALTSCRQAKSGEYTDVQSVMRSDNPALSEFLARIYKEKIEGLPLDDEKKYLELLKLKKRVLRWIGLSKIGHPPFDQYALLYTAQAGKIIDTLQERTIDQLFVGLTHSHATYYKRLANASREVKRAEIQIRLAEELAENELIQSVEETATLEELTAAFEATKNNTPKPEKQRSSTSVSLVDENGDPLPIGSFFTERGESPFTLVQWASLPLRPLILPAGKPKDTSPRSLAEFLFDEILYARFVCDRRGKEVGMSEKAREQYIRRIQFAVERGEPIIASEYMPWIAVPNPFKRVMQGQGLGEIDYFRRHAELSEAVRVFYQPGMQWLMFNEAPSFQGPRFKLDSDAVQKFHDDTVAIARLIDPQENSLRMYKMADLLWGTAERKALWDEFSTAHMAKLELAYRDGQHKEHEETVKFLNTFIGPMAACINPFKLDAARGLTAEQILDVYVRLRQITNSELRGVDIGGENLAKEVKLEGQQKVLFEYLYDWAFQMTLLYRTALASRDALPAFKEIIPTHAIGFTVTTKRDKAVIFGNSGKGAVFVPHGEPVLLRAKSPFERSTITIRPWYEIASHSDRYLPYYSPEREEPLYFEER